MTIHVTFRSGAKATFGVPSDITAKAFADLASLIDASGVSTFRIQR